ncbi:MAG: ATP-binding protein [Treponema sp.]|nr:ATP-binding protein [Treponema sp.]
MRSFFKKIFALITHVQVLSVLLAFALMVFLSYNYMSNIERGHLLSYVDNTFAHIQSQIDADLMEPEIAFGLVAENVRNMILRGFPSGSIQEFFNDTTRYITTFGRLVENTSGVYGYFYVFDDLFISGIKWDEPEYYNPQERPWYKAAIDADGEIAITEPYYSYATNTLNLTFARQIFDNEGNPLAIICLDVLLDNIIDYAINSSVTEGSYGILFDENFNVIAHPVLERFLGRNIELMNDGVAIKNILLEGGEISERKVRDYNGDESVGFFRKLHNGWYLGIIAYANVYYQSVREIGGLLSLMGFVLASILIAILLSVVSGRRKAEERTKIMLDSVPVCINMWNKNYEIIDCNQEAANLFNMSSKKEYQEKFSKLSPEYQSDGSKSTDLILKKLKEVFDEGYTSFEWMHQKLNGELIPSEVILVRVKHRNGDIVCGYTRDMREINMAMAKLREADERNMLMLDGAPLGVFMWDEKHNLLDFNYEAARVIGIFNKDEFRIKFKETMPEYQTNGRLSKDVLSDFIDVIFKEGSSHITWHHNTVDGESIPFDALGIRLVLREDPVAVVYTHDLRELNKATAKMREADECAQVMFDATPLSCFMIDKYLNVVNCNQEIARLFGLKDKSEYINNTSNFYPGYQPTGHLSKDYIDRHIYEAFDEGYCRFELMHQKIDGEQIPTEVTLVRVKFKGDYAIAGYIRDLREVKAMVAEMRRAEVAEESSRAKSDFLAKMSHEIRTPMNAILGITEIQLHDNTLPLITREALERIYNSGDLLLSIINDILDLSKIEAGKLELVSSLYDIASLIHDTVKLNIMRYESKPIEFILTVSEEIPSMFTGDELRIKQILNNLLSNAFKYTQEGKIELKLSSRMSEDNSIATLIISVSDTGQGMTSDQVKRLGDKFSRFNMEANRKTEGTGLGMNITRNLIQLMGGEIFIESSPGKGSVFTVRLPQNCVNPQPIGIELAENLMKLNLKNTAKLRNAQITQEFMPYGRVLVVDDVETNLYVARGLMAPYGISIDTAISGFEAIDRIKDGLEYDIVFMDHMMPKMDGIEATKIIRGLGYNKPVVALTANALAGQAAMFLKNGFDDFISKPIDIRQLNSMLNKLIRDKQPPEAIDEARKQKQTLYAAGKHNIAVDSQLAEFFARDARKAIDVFNSIYKHSCRRVDDLSTFIINIHSMKSALANVGETDLSSNASNLEQAGRDNNISLILNMLPDFITSLNQVIDKLKPAYDDSENEDSEVISEENKNFLREKLDSIEEACVSYNKKAAKNAINQLKQKTWPRVTREQLSDILEHLLHSEFDEAADIARNILGGLD